MASMWEAYVKDKIYGMYPPSRCITPERLCACADERNEGDGSNTKSSHSVMNNHISADTEGHLPGETHDHYALVEGDAAANTKMSDVKSNSLISSLDLIFVHLSWQHVRWCLIYWLIWKP